MASVAELQAALSASSNPSPIQSGENGTDSPVTVVAARRFDELEHAGTTMLVSRRLRGADRVVQEEILDASLSPAAASSLPHPSISRETSDSSIGTVAEDLEQWEDEGGSFSPHSPAAASSASHPSITRETSVSSPGTAAEDLEPWGDFVRPFTPNARSVSSNGTDGDVGADDDSWLDVEEITRTFKPRWMESPVLEPGSSPEPPSPGTTGDVRAWGVDCGGFTPVVALDEPLDPDKALARFAPATPRAGVAATVTTASTAVSPDRSPAVFSPVLSPALRLDQEKPVVEHRGGNGSVKVYYTEEGKRVAVKEAFQKGGIGPFEQQMADLGSDHVPKAVPTRKPKATVLATEGFDPVNGSDYRPSEAGRFALDVLRAQRGAKEDYAAAHEGVRLVHLDLKFGNILKDPESGMIKVADWGVATHEGLKSTEAKWLDKKLQNEKARLGGFAPPRGSPATVAPENIDSEAPLTDKSDAWAVGIMMYQIITGKFHPMRDSEAGVSPEMFYAGAYGVLADLEDPKHEMHLREFDEAIYTAKQQGRDSGVSERELEIMEGLLKLDPAKRFSTLEAQHALSCVVQELQRRKTQ
ncbi:MAG: hypothetical protein SP1CHLAM54_03840 [Chlamydiia bacterium]|nr:hypothetical protein [Chlamydiia bacterium]MCH9615299.1 hypothetical protein [Chlamydiia bacterium]MCH9628379.1 hypothetical protein [Chlamydiia bacterium]